MSLHNVTVADIRCDVAAYMYVLYSINCQSTAGCCGAIFTSSPRKIYLHSVVVSTKSDHCFKTRRRSESAYIRQVHDIVMMYTSIRLHKHLPVMYVRSRRLPMIMMSSIMTAWCGVTGVCGNPSKTVLTFLYISPQPPFQFWTWLRHQKAT